MYDLVKLPKAVENPNTHRRDGFQGPLSDSEPVTMADKAKLEDAVAVDVENAERL
jgi:hypothetical protein